MTCQNVETVGMVLFQKRTAFAQMIVPTFI